MKERLTKRIGDGVQYEDGKYIVTCYPKNNNLNSVDKMAVKLCKLEDKIENGTLIELPCAVGDTVWFLNDRYHIKLSINTIYEAVVTRIVILRDNKGNPEVALVIQYRDENGCTEIQGIKDFGKTVFLTKEEAEKALAERCEGK